MQSTVGYHNGLIKQWVLKALDGKCSKEGLTCKQALRCSFGTASQSFTLTLVLQLLTIWSTTQLLLINFSTA